MRALRAASRVLASVALLAVTACPDATQSSHAQTNDAATVGTGSLAVQVVDEKDRPIEGAVVWALGTKTEAPVPAEPVVLAQRGLEFRPRFLVARKGQTLRITNEDEELHNVHSSDACCAMNDAMGAGKVVEKKLEQPGEV